MKQHIVFDVEAIGKNKPIFLVCTKIVETGETEAFWMHKRGHMKSLHKRLLNPNYTWVSFNGINFDAPLLCAAVQGADALWLKETASQIIEQEMRAWQTYNDFGIEFIDFDHIDLIETAPGVMISLKTYAGRLGYRTMVDMPFPHNVDLKPSQYQECENYCINDLGVTEALFNELKQSLNLRVELGKQHGIDLRSRSDAQAAELILKQELGIGKVQKHIPQLVGYQAPDIIRTKSPALLDLINRFEQTHFKINPKNGSPEPAAWMEEPFVLGKGVYQIGMGGLHSTHDVQFYKRASEELLISDFDVASYYPNIMMKCNLIPRLPGNLGQRFLDVYADIYHQRIAAKAAGNKAVADSLKIVLNGTFGKLGSIYSVFYSPDVMLAVTITGQLNLLCLIDRLERIPGVEVYSANTDGITVGYTPAARDKVLKVFSQNIKYTGFEYEETPYSCIAMKDVNNYIAITTSGKAKRKGLYASNDPKKNSLFLMKNPAMEVCANMAVDYLTKGSFNIKDYTDMKDFVAIRNVKGGGIQHTHTVMVDDWLGKPRAWYRPQWEDGHVEKRVSRPKPVEVGMGGTPFGRVARWYMSTKEQPPISYVGSGNKVPKTDGAQLCMTLPDKLPDDLDYDWYIKETISMLQDMGVNYEERNG
jgi:hypothetical protein